MQLRRPALSFARGTFICAILLALCACERPRRKAGPPTCSSDGHECCDAGATCQQPAADGGVVWDAGVDDEWSQWPAPSDVPVDSQYAVSADGTTVTDSATGLVWQRVVPENPCPPDGMGVCTWPDARTYCSGLTLGGFPAGWRLPTLVELISIVSLGGFDPSIDSNVFPGTTSSGFWTSTAYSSEGGGAWVVGFDSGSTSGISSMGSGSVRCVR